MYVPCSKPKPECTTRARLKGMPFKSLAVDRMTPPVGKDSVLASKETAFDRRLLELRTKAKAFSGTVDTEIVGNAIIQSLGSQVAPDVVLALEELKSTRNPIKDAAFLIQKLDLEDQKERAAAVALTLLKADKNWGATVKTAELFVQKKRKGTGFGSMELLQTLSAPRPLPNVLNKYAGSKQLMRDLHTLTGLAQDNDLVDKDLELASKVFPKNDEAGPRAFLRARGNVARRILAGIKASDHRQEEQSMTRSAYRYLGRTSHPDGRLHLRVAAIAEENQWVGPVLTQGLLSAATEEKWETLAAHVLPDEGAALAMSRLAVGLDMEGVRAKDRELVKLSTVYSNVAIMASRMPAEKQQPFLKKALEVGGTLEKPDLTGILLATSDHWFPDLGYETDMSFVPRVLKSLTSDDYDQHLCYFLKKSMGTALEEVNTMGGSHARQRLLSSLEKLQEKKQSGLFRTHDHFHREADDPRLLDDVDDVVGYLSIGGLSAFAATALLNPLAGVATACAFGLGFAVGKIPFGRSEAMKEKKPGHTLYPLPREYGVQ